MGKKETIYEIVGLYDKVAELEGENQVLRIKLGTLQAGSQNSAPVVTTDDATKTESLLGEKTPAQTLAELVTKHYFNDCIASSMRGHSVLVREDDKDRILTYAEWRKSLSPSDFGSSWHSDQQRALFGQCSIQDVTRFFEVYIKQIYDGLVRSAQQRLKEEEEKEKEND